MKRLTTWVPLVLLIIMMALTGCGGGSSDKSATAGSESIYDAGVPVPAVGFNEAATIALAQSTDEGFIPLKDGTVVGGGNVTLGVQITDGAFGRGRVFVTDGGGYQVEAKDNGSGYYVCKFYFDPEKLVVPVLVQEIYDNGKASKAKFMLWTQNHASSTQLVRDGLGLMASDAALGKLAGPLGKMLGLTLEDLAPANAAGRALGCALKAKVALIENVLYLNPNIGLSDGLDNITAADNTAIESKMQMILNIGGVLPIKDSPMCIALADQLGGLGGDEDGLMGAVFSGLNLTDKFLFLGLNGRPSKASDAVAELGIGILPVYDPAAGGKSDNATLPSGLTIYDTSYRFGKNANTLTTNANDIALGVDFTQAGLSQLLAGILGNSKIVLAGGDLPIPLAIPADSTGTVTLTFNASGIAFDTLLNRLIINDVRMEYKEGSASKWLISLDMSFDVDAGYHTVNNDKSPVNGHSFLDLSLTLVPNLSHCHVLKDNKGITIFDHGNFVVALVETLGKMLGGSGTTIYYPLDLTDMAGAVLAENDGLVISNEDLGHCFMKMAMQDLSPNCFIETASR